jgi:hypothetical protein
MAIGLGARPSKLQHAISVLTSRKWKKNWMNFRRKKERNNKENIRLEEHFYGKRKIIYLGHKCASFMYSNCNGFRTWRLVASTMLICKNKADSN